MASVYDRRRQQQQQLLHHKTIFLPLFCRLSLKDINLSRRRRRDSALSDEPSSPKVGCMGQVKRNNRVTSATAATPTPTPTHNHKYSKLRKLFSSKTLLPTTTAACIAAAVGGGGSKSCTSSKELVCADYDLRRSKLKKDCERDCAKVVDVGELDPPLPVLKKAAGEEVNLWKRRFNGAALNTLQIQNSNFVSLPPTV